MYYLDAVAVLTLWDSKASISVMPEIQPGWKRAEFLIVVFADCSLWAFWNYKTDQDFNSEITQCLLACKLTKPKAVFNDEVKHFYQVQLFCPQALHLQYPINELHWCLVDPVVNVLSDFSAT